MKGYDCDSKPQRPAPKFRSTENKERKPTKRKQSCSAGQGPSENLPLEDESLLGENFDFEYPASLSPASTADSIDAISKIEVATQTEYRSPEKKKRDYFIDQATCPKNCYRYTGVTRSKLELLFEFLEPKATDIHIQRGRKNTKESSKKEQLKQRKRQILMMES